jgi:signal peptidase I
MQMSIAPAEARHASPWLTMWFKPRQTIERIVSADPGRYLWLLVGIVSIGNFVSAVPMQTTLSLLDWRVIVALLVALPVLGMVFLYLQALFFKWIARLFGGKAPAVHIRAALAWGYLPIALGGVLVLLLFTLSGYFSPDEAWSRRSSPFIGAIGGVAAIWALVFAALMLARVQNFGFWRGTITFILGIVISTLVLVLLLALPVRAFVFQPFNIPSGAMMPTLLVGDHLFASKFAYGYSRYSLPGPPLPISGRLFGSEPQRGDVVIFRLPSDTTVDYVKRVIGLPGERIQLIGGVVHINGEPVKREEIEPFVFAESGIERQVKRWRETLPHGVAHETLDLIVGSDADDTQEFHVPAGQYFVLGDNRDNSTDSRFFGGRGVGFVPFENIVGRADLIYISAGKAPRLVH